MFGFSTTFDMRCSGTPWEVKGVPLSLDTHPEYIPTRADFLCQRSLRLFYCYLTLSLLTLGIHAMENSSLYPSVLIPVFRLLREVTKEQLSSKAHDNCGLQNPDCMHNLDHVWCRCYCLRGSSTYRIRNIGDQFISPSMTPILCVAPGGKSASLCGLSIALPTSTAWLVVNTFFCTINCHQFNRRKFVSPTTYLIYNLLPFRRGSVPARYLCVFLFFLSLVSARKQQSCRRHYMASARITSVLFIAILRNLT
jgi:hypothetical protein